MTPNPSFEDLERRIREIEQVSSEQQDPDGEFVLTPERGGFYSLDAEWRFVYINPVAERVLGISPAEVLGRSFWEVFPLKVGTRLESEYRRAAAGEVRDFENLYQPWNRWFHNTCLPLSGGGMAVHFRDITEQKRVEQKLRDQERVLSEILEDTLSGYWDWNIPEGVEYLSPAFKKMFGYEDHELPNLPETWQRLILPEDLAFVMEAFDRHVRSRGREPFYNEVRYRHKNGSVVWVICTGRVIEWGDDGSPIRMIGCHVDITERKQDEEALRESEEKYRTLFETGSDAMVLAEIGTGRILDANEVSTALYGYSRDELLKMTVMDLSNEPEEARKAVEHRVRRLPLRYHRKKDGSLFPVTIVVNELRLQGRAIRIAAIRDISERRQAEEALSQSRTEFEAIFNAVPDAVIFTDPGRRIKRVSPSFTRTFGYGPEEVKARTTEFLYESRADYEGAGSRCWGEDGNKSRAFEVNFRRKDGIVFRSETLIEPVMDKNGKIIGSLGVHRDITERKRAEAALRESEKRAKRAAAVNSTMAEIGRIITSSLSIDETYEQFAGVVKKIIPFDRLRVSIINPEQGTYLIAHASGIDIPGRRRGDSVPLPHFLDEMGRKRSGILVQAVDESTFREEYPLFLPAFRAGIRSCIVAPLISKGELKGTLLFSSLRSEAYTEGDLRLAEEVATQISGAVANAELFAEHQQAGKKLLESERKFRNLFDNSSDAILIHDLAGQIVEANEVASTRLGYTHEELLRMTVMDISTREFAFLVPERICITVRENRQVFSSVNKRMDGTTFPVEVHSRAIEYGGKSCVLSVTRDVTERKRTEEELIKHRDRLEELVKERTNELEQKSRSLEELNVTLKVLLRQVQEDRERLEHRLVANVKRLVLPYVEKIRKGHLDERTRSHLQIVEDNLNEIMSPFLHKVQQLNLTPRETQVAALVKDGKTTKEIGEIMGIAPSAVNTLRNRMRHKLHLNKKKVGLRTYLQSLT